MDIISYWPLLWLIVLAPLVVVYRRSLVERRRPQLRQPGPVVESCIMGEEGLEPHPVGLIVTLPLVKFSASKIVSVPTLIAPACVTEQAETSRKKKQESPRRQYKSFHF